VKVQEGSFVRKLLERDQAQVPHTLNALRDVHVSGAFCVEAAPDAFAAFFRSLRTATENTTRTRDRELAGVVALICARYTKWGVTDLLRGRTTAVLGYCRVQAEAAALAHLFVADPSKAEDWFKARGGSAGKCFYRANQSALMAIMQQHPGLADVYDRGSEEALHVRATVLTRGHDIVRTPGSQDPTLYLLDNELREDDALPFLHAATSLPTRSVALN
jgi:hypothetical protein